MAAQSVHADLVTGLVHDHGREETVAMSKGQARAFGLQEFLDCGGGGN